MINSLDFLGKSDLVAIGDKVGGIVAIDAIPQGLVHWVYKITGSKRTAYLKLR